MGEFRRKQNTILNARRRETLDFKPAENKKSTPRKTKRNSK